MSFRGLLKTQRMDSARNGGICRRFLNGSCRFGSRCFYRHDWTIIQPPQICRYFQKGECWYGERCRYLHILQPDAGTAVSGRRGSVPSVSSSSVAHTSSDRRGSEPALLRTIVTSRQECSGLESTVDASNSQRISGPLTQHAKEQPQDTGEKTGSESGQNSGIARSSAYLRIEGSSEIEPQEGGAAAAASSNKSEEEIKAFLQSKNVICGICMEKVYEKENTREHIFGLLPNCNHPFCLKCISTWRKTKDLSSDVVRACPQCRVKSAFYVPSKVWIEGAAKESAVDAFKKKFSKRRCCIYDRHGHCPFKTECLYRHVRNSSHVAFSYFSDDDDEYEDENSVDLLGFFLAMTLLGGDDSDDEDFPFYLNREYEF